MFAGLTAGKFVGGAAIIGILTTSWSYVKTFFSKIYSLIFIRVIIRGQAKRAVQMLLQSEFKCSTIGVKEITGKNEYVRPKQRNQMVGFEKIPREATIWWRNWKPLVISSEGSFKITFLRGMYNKDTLLIEAINKFNAIQREENWVDGDRFRVIRKYGSIGKEMIGTSQSHDKTETPTNGEWDDDGDYYETSFKEVHKPIGWNRDDLGQPKPQGAMDALALNESAHEAIREAFLWRNNETWFKSHSIPWKRGWQIYGKTGTGKTAFVRALGQELNLPVLLFDLSTMTNVDFSEAWNDAMDYSPCIVLFEDIDGVFDGRKNIANKGMKQGLSFDCFLNTIDGVENTDGIFKIITTNYVDKIDPALGVVATGNEMSTRPGRIDRVIKFDLPDFQGRDKIASRILCDFPKKTWEYIIEEGNEDTGAQFQERCCRKALNLFWEKEQLKVN